LGFNPQFLHAVIGVGRAQRGAYCEGLDAPRIVDGVIIGRCSTGVPRGIASSIIDKRPCGGGALLDRAQAVIIGRVGINVHRAVRGFRQPVAVIVIGPSPRAVRRRSAGSCSCQAPRIGVAVSLVIGRSEAIGNTGDVGKCGFELKIFQLLY
jgi:hypothetical protein